MPRMNVLAQSFAMMARSTPGAGNCTEILDIFSIIGQRVWVKISGKAAGHQSRSSLGTAEKRSEQSGGGMGGIRGQWRQRCNSAQAHTDPTGSWELPTVATSAPPTSDSLHLLPAWNT